VLQGRQRELAVRAGTLGLDLQAELGEEILHEEIHADFDLVLDSIQGEDSVYNPDSSKGRRTDAVQKGRLIALYASHTL